LLIRPASLTVKSLISSDMQHYPF